LLLHTYNSPSKLGTLLISSYFKNLQELYILGKRFLAIIFIAREMLTNYHVLSWFSSLVKNVNFIPILVAPTDTTGKVIKKNRF
jgi:hypothetical protein